MSAMLAGSQLSFLAYDTKNQCCGSGMFISDTDFYPSLIPDLGSNNSKKREWRKKFVVLPFFVATNVTKFKIMLFLNWWGIMLFANFQTITVFSPQKL
jgi:hypothetical protein